MSDTTWSKEEFEETVASLQKQARTIFTRDGCHIPIAFVFATRDFRTGEKGKHIFPIAAESFTNDAEKDGFAEAIQRVAEVAQAVGLLFISEVWTTNFRAPEGMDEETVRRTATRPSDDPNRNEALFMSAEHPRFGTRTYYAQISRDADDKPAIAEWELSSGTSVTGRFVHLLPQMA
jgi:hypothetical protein